LRLIPANEYRRERWRNGLGWTREIARGEIEAPHKDVRVLAEGSAPATGDPHKEVRAIADGPASATNWDWRLSIAEIDTDCRFSAFPGCDRVLVLLAGNGMHLEFDDSTYANLQPPHGRVAFAGERGVQCRLLDGPTADFNAIVRRDRCTMQVYHRPLVGSMVFFAEAGVLWAINLVAGRATVKSAGVSVSLNAGDTVLLGDTSFQETGTDEAASRSILDGGGDVLLVRIQRVA